MNFKDGWITPDWPAPSNVGAICSTREGGRSAPPYDSLNLGLHVGDDSMAVRANREIYAHRTGARPVFMNQVHGQRVEVLAQATNDGVEADGCVTAAPGVACTIMVADCLPVLFAIDDGTAVGAAHAGWRGLAGEGGEGVLESVCKSLLEQSGAPASRVLAWLGPCIGPRAFEVGPEVKAAFVGLDAGGPSMFVPHRPDKWFANLAGLARMRLRALGISQIYGNDGSDEWCTASNPSRFFSFRRDGLSGRFAASVWLR